LKVKENNYNGLTDDQSLRVQEMFDNKNHQHLQEKFNKIIIILTAFIVLGGIFEFVILAHDKFGFDSTPWFWIFGFAFLIAGLLFLYVSIPASNPAHLAIIAFAGPLINLILFLTLQKEEMDQTENHMSLQCWKCLEFHIQAQTP